MEYMKQKCSSYFTSRRAIQMQQIEIQIINNTNVTNEDIIEGQKLFYFIIISHPHMTKYSLLKFVDSFEEI